LLQGAGLLLALFLLFQYLLPSLNDWLKLLLGAIGFDTHGLDVLVMSQRGATDGIDIRLSEWRKAWQMFMESPIWGVGIGNYGWYSFNYQATAEYSSVPEGTLFDHSHNLIMQVLAELGIAGLVLLFFMAATWLRQMLPLWKNASHWLILILVSVLFLHSNVEYPLWYSYFLGFTAILIGLGTEKTLNAQFTPMLGQLTAGVTLFLSSAILIITFRGFLDISQINRLVFTSSPQQAAATLSAISKNLLLTPWAEATMAQYGAPAKNVVDQQLAMTTRIMQYRPAPIAVNRQIIYLALAGKSTEASSLMKKAFIVYPTDFLQFACDWKLAPAEEARQLWVEAQKLAGDNIQCQTKMKTTTSSS
jgi:O-antigen ligase